MPISPRLLRPISSQDAAPPPPPTAPEAPTGVSGTAGNAQVSLTWAAPPDGGSPITDYVIQYSSDAGSTWLTFADGTSATSSATVTGLTNGTAYIFRVAATNSVGTSSYSAASASITPVTTPAAPTSVSATPGNTQASVSWTAPASNGGSAITDYVVQFSSDSGATWATFSDGTSTATSATVTGLTNGTAYVFRVAATNAVGQGAYSTASSPATPLTVPGAPTSLSATAGDASASLAWTAPASNGGSAITDYVVQFSANLGSTWSTFSDGTSTATSATVTGLTNGTTYIFRVAATNAAGTGTYSAESSGTTPTSTATAPGAPTSVTGTSGDTTVMLSWTAPASDGGASITDYVIQYSSNSGSTWTTFSDGTSTSTSATVTGLTNGTAYIFQVAAVNSVGQGSYSTASASVTPAAPTILDDPYLTSVVLHLHCDGTNGSTTFTDSGPLGLPVTANGNAQVSTAQSRFGGASLLLDGNGDFLSFTSNEVTQLGANSFTLECWIRPTAAAGGSILSNVDSWQAGRYGLTCGQPGQSRKLQFFVFSINNSLPILSSASAVPLDQWSHVAVTRSGSAWYMFIDGTQVATYTSATSVGDPLSLTTRIGASDGGAQQMFAGNIDELRFTRGIARYTASFTAPVAPFQDKGTADPFYESTALLLHMDGANNATSFPDNSRHSRTVTANGSAKVTTAVGKFAQAMDAAASASDFLSVSGTSLGFGAGDFTVEGWYLRTTSSFTTGGVSVWLPQDNSAGSNKFQFYVQSDNRMVCAIYGLELAASSALSWNLNQWYHLAATRSNGSAVRLFRDGVQVASGTRTNALLNDTTYRVTPQNPGHFLDDIRVTRGVARYVAAFTPPTSAHPDAGLVTMNADAADWLDRVYANSGTVSASTAAAVNRFCNAIDAAGLRSKFYRLNLFCGGNLNACIVPLYRGQSLGGTQYGNTTDTNVGPFVAGDYVETGTSGGLSGNGTSKYLQTGFPGNTLATGDRHLCVYESRRETNTYRAFIGTQDDGGGTYYWLLRTDAAATTVSGVTGATVNSTGNSTGGQWLMSEPSNSSTVLYKNGSSVGSSSAALRGLPSAQTIPVFAYQASPSSTFPAGYSNARLNAYSLGLSLDATQAADFYTAMQNFQTALGRQV